jgi:hypothetical protein
LFDGYQFEASTFFSGSAEYHFCDRTRGPTPHLSLRFRLAKIKDFVAEMGGSRRAAADESICLDPGCADRFQHRTILGFALSSRCAAGHPDQDDQLSTEFNRRGFFCTLRTDVLLEGVYRSAPGDRQGVDGASPSR